jgi:hypothetical protein
MTTEEIKQLVKIEDLGREAIRTAIGEVSGTTSSERAREALREFRDAVSPSLLIDLIREWRERASK